MNDEDLRTRFDELTELHTAARFRLSKARRLLSEFVDDLDCAPEDGMCAVHNWPLSEDELCRVFEAREFLRFWRSDSDV